MTTINYVKSYANINLKDNIKVQSTSIKNDWEYE